MYHSQALAFVNAVIVANKLVTAGQTHDVAVKEEGIKPYCTLAHVYQTLCDAHGQQAIELLVIAPSELPEHLRKTSVVGSRPIAKTALSATWRWLSCLWRGCRARAVGDLMCRSARERGERIYG